MIEEHVHFYADNLKLEGILTYNEDAMPTSSILLCSPHPNLGGDMDNNVITSVARISAGIGFVSLRFNYRGAGNSESNQKDTAENFLYWESTMSGENYGDAVIDTQAALNFLVSQAGIQNNTFLAGYSFGAIVGMRVVVKNDSVKAFAAISAPFGKYNLDFLNHYSKPKLFIYTHNDFATTAEDTLMGFSKIPLPKALELIPESDHFYRQKEDEVSRKVCNFFLQYV